MASRRRGGCRAGVLGPVAGVLPVGGGAPGTPARARALRGRGGAGRGEAAPDNEVRPVRPDGGPRHAPRLRAPQQSKGR